VFLSINLKTPTNIYLCN